MCTQHSLPCDDPTERKGDANEGKEKVKESGCSLAKGVAWLAKLVSFVSLFLYALQTVPVENN